MKTLKLLLVLLLTAGLFYALNTKLGSVPPLGKFLAPNQGIWQNEMTENHTDDLDLAGLEAPVTVYYDAYLIPHVFAENDTDLYRAQGYITAQHRLWQMEFQTRAAAGRISEIIGDAALNFDRGQRRKGMVFGAENALSKMQDNPKTQAILEAYTAGINAYISQLEKEDLPVEYKLLDYEPEPWTPKKTALLLMYMTDMLAGGDSDLEYTNFLRTFGKDRFDLLYPDFYDIIDPVIPKEKEYTDWMVEVPEAPTQDSLLAFSAQELPEPHPDNGSNNWAIAPKLSTTNNAILANDPHLGLRLPSIWYVMQLSTPEKNTLGATLPGAVGIIIGFNEHIAWGVTNATRDVKDWYKIEFQDDSRSKYRYDGAWKPTTQKIEEIKIRGNEVYRDTVVYTHHGPVTYDQSFNSNQGLEGYAMRWTGHLGGNNQETFLSLNKAKNYEEYLEAIKHFVAPAQNFVFASTSGDIALWVQGLFPNKWEGQGKFLMDGSDPKNDWQGFIPQEYNAHILNPQRGFVSSANQHPVGPSYPYYVFNDGYDTYRSRVINNFFRSKEQFDVEDFKSLQQNNYNLQAAEYLPMLLQEMKTDKLTPVETEYLNELKAWDFYNDIDKKGPTVFKIWSSELSQLLLDELENDSIAYDWPFIYSRYTLFRDHPRDTFMDIVETEDVETAADLYQISFKEAVAKLEDWKSDREDYSWGSYKATYIGHLLQNLPAFSRFNLPIGGDSGIVNATSKNHGPSWRMIVELSDPPQAQGIYPGGQSGNPGSKFYDNFVDQWAAGEYINLPFYLSKDESKNALYTVQLSPVQ
ncbi:penicillin acylase family protein [Croceiramulus getboli]|nr:penicillin acylase family protein [Flavobacteriaceae bacterium YJPT1-3]